MVLNAIRQRPILLESFRVPAQLKANGPYEVAELGIEIGNSRAENSNRHDVTLYDIPQRGAQGCERFGIGPEP